VKTHCLLTFLNAAPLFPILPLHLAAEEKPAAPAAQSRPGVSKPTNETLNNLPHLGLMITADYRTQQLGALEDASPEHASVRKAVAKAMGSLIKLDGSADR
jgi:hypothetical protein